MEYNPNYCRKHHALNFKRYPTLRLAYNKIPRDTPIVELKTMQLLSNVYIRVEKYVYLCMSKVLQALISRNDTVYRHHRVCNTFVFIMPDNTIDCGMRTNDILYTFESAIMGYFQYICYECRKYISSWLIIYYDTLTGTIK